VTPCCAPPSETSTAGSWTPSIPSWIGHRLHVEAHLDVDERITASEAHLLAHDAGHRLTDALPELREAAIHAYPAAR
jgi:divalent metal cation (Fe/Co/Zn/Cd) transporter